MDINLDSALQTYIVEARDLLHQMEEALLVLENDPNDSDTVDSLFRGAHTIKGSAGLFGLTPIVSFTHGVEDLLDRVRDATLNIDSALIALLLACTDHICELVDVVAERSASLDAQAVQRENALRERLMTYQVSTPTSPDTWVRQSVIDDSAVRAANLDWHISLRFGEQVYRNGMDPFSFLRYLNTLGEILHIVTTTTAMPALPEMDPESCYLGFDIRFRSAQTFETINEAFDFVRDDCAVHILSPRASLSEFAALLGQLPESRDHAERLLVESGSLLPGELDSVQSQLPTQPSPSTDLELPADPVQLRGDSAPQATAREQKSRESRYVRVHADKLEELINLVGELVIAGAGAKLLASYNPESELRDATAAVAELVEKTLDCALRMRMVPIGDTFSRFQRVVRDVSKELGKDIELEISGGETELDKTVVERIGDPLMHLIRNALDHGIEAPAVRQANGKQARGRLRLNAFHDAGNIVVEIIDDGRGLDRERILEKGRERNLVPAGATPSDSDIYNLIFEPGFSTAEAVTNLSGRGVGMDVVKRNITALRGSIDLDSRSGEGTTVRIRLPLTLAIIDGFLVGVGEAFYVIPLERVQECMELTSAANDAARRCGYIDLRGEVLPLLFMHDYFSIEEAGAGSRRQNVVVVHHLSKKIGLVVDELMGEYQTVIKPLGKLFGALHGFGGSSILGNGAIALILDIPALLTRLSEDSRACVSKSTTTSESLSVSQGQRS
ncbi:chemotaxis protein CheA [Pseudomonas sp. B2M1-30]|uniref:chemotaxis protein CheA n=1 Tax=Pseudomonas TaxID=286 RepID=UPI001C3D115E|nr:MULTISPECIES: chemotaxis protein CheA [Pseudomonas]MBV4473601.1 chemotaxis protein CheA [Pseudomonas botevensis]MCU0117741.1 chemotaxis protein CheA [Pseudomonas sp. B2M1-30]MCU7259277.1 chemotaxis protein CheA [Pseudomonas koreensis]